MESRPPRGRQREARRNDGKILAAAANLLVTDRGATMADIARAADVGVASLYRRFADKEQLIAALLVETMGRVTAVARRHSREEGPEELAVFLLEAVTAGAGSLRALAGKFPPGPEAEDQAAVMFEAITEVHRRSVAAGSLRPEVTVADFNHLFSMVHAVSGTDEGRTRALRRRYVTLLLPGMSVSGHQPTLPGEAPTVDEVVAGWQIGR